MTYVIVEGCEKDGNCVAVCPVDCIATTDDAPTYYINPDECIDCGVCVSDCPQNAIYVADELPPDKAQYREVNAAFFGK